MLLKFSDFQIRSDSHNFTLDRVRVVADKESPKFGEEYTVPERFYPDLGSACNGLLKERIKESEAASIQELRELCEQTVADIKAAIGNVGEGLVKRKNEKDATVSDEEDSEADDLTCDHGVSKDDHCSKCDE